MNEIYLENSFIILLHSKQFPRYILILSYSTKATNKLYLLITLHEKNWARREYLQSLYPASRLRLAYQGCSHSSLPSI